MTLVPEMTAGDDRIRVFIEDHTGNRRREVRVVAQASAKELIPALITALGLPATNPAGRPVTYHLALRDRQLLSDETLASAGVVDGACLTLVPEMTAGCFPAGIRISLPDYTQVPIETLKVDDQVLSYDTNNRTLCSSRITEIIEVLAESFLLINEVLGITETHRVYSNGEWVRAGSLKCGDRLYTLTNGDTTIEKLERQEQQTKVYNLCLASDAHTFFAEDVLVHNHTNKAMVATPDTSFDIEVGNAEGLITQNYAFENLSVILDTEKETAEAFAVVEIYNHSDGEPFFIGREYHLYTGIVKDPTMDVLQKPIKLPNVDIVEMDVAVIAQDMEILPNWSQTLYFYRDRDAGLLRFRLKPQKPGHKSIRIDFYHKRHWLQTLNIEVEALEEKQIAITVKDAISGNAYETLMSNALTVQQVTEEFLAQGNIPVLESGKPRLTYRLIFQGYLLSRKATLADSGVKDDAELLLVAETIGEE